ncbi:hypothetical protein [Flagellimonas sp. MMG031]|uniref:Alpha-L-arabinofuranosidase 1 catalytic domain-containing protein n=1 Tax=Flagellimonas sp. MMG031 TaxID=3158549 RepID=A0AAU7MWI1_9FLAO
MKQNKYFLYLLVCLLAIVHTPKLLGQNVQVNVEVSNTLTNIAQNPVGLCLSYPHDDTDYFPNRVRSTTEAFNSIQGGTLRFPMGALADNYLWHEPGDYQNAVNGLNPRIASEGRNPAPWDWLVNTDGTIKDSALDFDEFVDLYQQTGTEPIIMVNAFGHVDAESLYSYEQIKTNAVEWVRYANITKNLNIKYWEIGNELSVEVNKGHITVQEYIDLFNDFADAMKAVDPTIKVGLGLGFGHFDQVLAGTYTKADFVVPHQYQGFENYNEYKNLISPPPLTYITNANNAISNLPAPYRDTIEILATEFSSFSPQGSWKSPNGSNDPANTIGKSLVTFEMITSALAQYDRIAYMHFWTTHSAFNAMGFSDKYANAFDQYLNTLPQGNALTIFNMFRKDRMVQTSSTSSLIRSYASYSPNSEELSIYLINKDTNPVPVDINNIDNASQLGSGNIWTYAGNTGSPEDTATSISQTGTASPQGNGYSITLPPVSVTVINTTQILLQLYLQQVRPASTMNRLVVLFNGPHYPTLRVPVIRK